MKWQPASFIPLGFEMNRAMFKDQERQLKPLLDQYEKEEFDRSIAYAMEYNSSLKINVWSDGYKETILYKKSISIPCISPRNIDK
ncbi:YolD-like family protein [Neobacillus sp. 179-C4.2 HS]|uniref:YolD-like family protein n=1 Tax=Neobacillus driksii TaxID=3035913 RepID=A0ABV4YRP6_9BACI|nr:YolD-like family protein [Neobacillus sp. 179.-C4.2 HS]MDP5195111.1 YolD-like family protein [Neobacillus sp. 179.-C4.2 HS]